MLRQRVHGYIAFLRHLDIADKVAQPPYITQDIHLQIRLAGFLRLRQSVAVRLHRTGQVILIIVCVSQKVQRGYLIAHLACFSEHLHTTTRTLLGLVIILISVVNRTLKIPRSTYLVHHDRPIVLVSIGEHLFEQGACLAIVGILSFHHRYRQKIGAIHISIRQFFFLLVGQLGCHQPLG